MLARFLRMRRVEIAEAYTRDELWMGSRDLDQLHQDVQVVLCGILDIEPLVISNTILSRAGEAA